MSVHLQYQSRGEATAFAFLCRQFLQSAAPIPQNIDLSGQTAIVTGANVGLGFECCRQLLAHNLSRLIIAVRSRARGDAAAKKLSTEFPSVNIEVSLVDMASYDSIRDFAKRCEKLGRIDIAILNAGLSQRSFTIAEQTGHEMTFQVNYLSTALLTLLLLPSLRAERGTSAPARLTVVGSDTAYYASWKGATYDSIIDAMDNGEAYDSWEAYKTSKLLLLMFIYELSQRVPAEEVTMNVCNPGACRGTKFGSEDRTRWLAALIYVSSWIIGRSPSVGAQHYTDAVTVKGMEGHGSFISDGRIKPFPPLMYEEAGESLRSALWIETLKEFAFVKQPST